MKIAKLLYCYIAGNRYNNRKIVGFTRYKTAPGFTLIELLIVVAILGVLAGGVVVAIDPIGKINSANLAKAKTFSASVENDLAIYQVGRWSFEEGAGPTAKDISGYGNDGTLAGGVSWQTASQCGLGFGGCLSFDGANDIVSLGGGKFDDLADGTLELWFKASATTGALYGHHVTDANRYNLYFNGNKIDFLLYTAGGNYDLPSDNVITAGQWYHVATVWGSRGGRLFINGVRQAQTTATVQGWDDMGASAYNMIGDRYSAGTLPFNGLIDEVKIYSQALSFAQIQQHYAQGLIKHQLAFK